MWVFGKSFYIYIFVLLGGVLIHSIFLSAQLSNTLLFIILGTSFLLFVFGKKLMKIIAVSIVIFIIGFLRFDMAINNNQKNVLNFFANEKIEITLEGTIIEKPIKQDGYQLLVILVDKIILGENYESLNTKISLKALDYQKYIYGQSIRFKTIPQIPESFESDGGRIFDYEHFLEKDGIYYVAKSNIIEIIDSGSGSIKRTLYKLKESLLKQIYKYIPKPESSLLAGVLLGEKTALGDDLEEDFRTTGLMHIVVLSGYNVSLIIIAVMFMLGPLPLYSRSIVAVLGIVAFALLVGAGPTVIRASIMALFIVLARVVGRPYDIGRALILAAVFMVAYNPWVLYFDISFQFSFFATMGLIILTPILEKKLLFIPKVLLLRDSAVATIAAQIMVAPLILYYIGDFSIISILVNMLVLFMVPISMFLGFIVSLFGFLIPSLAGIFAVPATMSLKYILWIVDLFAKIPLANISIPSFSWVWILAWYLIVFIFIRFKKISIGD